MLKLICKNCGGKFEDVEYPKEGCCPKCTAGKKEKRGELLEWVSKKQKTPLNHY
jgi:uncharacterized OB-fold protein